MDGGQAALLVEFGDLQIDDVHLSRQIAGAVDVAADESHHGALSLIAPSTAEDSRSINPCRP